MNIPLIKLRNAIYSAFPNKAEMLESILRAELYRRTIQRAGLTLPLPPFMKRAILHRHILENKCKTLVETGTQYGDTPWYFRNLLEEIYSIEMSSSLADLARKRFRRFRHVNILQGDSSEKLGEVIPRLKSKSLFWLDAHYSAGVTARGDIDCPIYAELQLIFQKSAID